MVTWLKQAMILVSLTGGGDDGSSRLSIEGLNKNTFVEEHHRSMKWTFIHFSKCLVVYRAAARSKDPASFFFTCNDRLLFYNWTVHCRSHTTGTNSTLFQSGHVLTIRCGLQDLCIFSVTNWLICWELRVVCIFFTLKLWTRLKAFSSSLSMPYLYKLNQDKNLK